jgi:DNA mismatch endonuclease (patch repair protein)
MNDIFSKEKRSDVMRSIKSKNTTPELITRRLLFSHGFRYSLHENGLPGKPDIVIRKLRTIIFVHGCFWHGHTCEIGSGSRKPKTHAQYWNRKILRNIERDEINRQKLLDLGWNVIVIWECETKDREVLCQRLNTLFESKEDLIKQ